MANLAILLRIRNNDGDRQEAERLLHLALADARRLRLPEAGQIEAILQQHGLRPLPSREREGPASAGG